MDPENQKLNDPAKLNTALVTGASCGIGKAVAIRLAALGYRVFLLGRDVASLEAVVAECASKGGVASCLAGNLEDPTRVEEAVTRATAFLGRIDVLINNAGTSRHEPVYSADLDAWRAMLDINFNSVVQLSRLVLPGMIERKCGAILNISSLSGRHTEGGNAIYAATKHALNGFTGCLYEDVREYGIKVSAIMPGFVDTALTSDLGKNAGNMIRPNDIADAVEFVLSSSPNCCPTEIVIRPQLRP